MTSFSYALSQDQLDFILEKQTAHIALDPQESYATLSPANQKALVHLVRAAHVLDDVFLQQDHPDNLAVRAFLAQRAATDPQAAQTYRLFKIFNGIEGLDHYAPVSCPLRLFKDMQLDPGKAFFPQGVTAAEVGAEIVKYPEKAAALLGNNTIVRREGDELIAVPYSVAFRREMQLAAREILAAAAHTDHKAFATYLRWQAQALVNDSDADTAYMAESLWIALEDSPLEFTISRESYKDRLSGSIMEIDAVRDVVEANGIAAKEKDAIGVRVGIVCPAAHAQLVAFRRAARKFAASTCCLRPHLASNVDSSLMTLIDTDLVALAGECASIRVAPTIAQVLPNMDKLTARLNVGYRNVFHHQFYTPADPAFCQRFLRALIAPSQQSLYDSEADFLFTVTHELSHTFGPRKTRDGGDITARLGSLYHVIEEAKADVGGLALAGYMASRGRMTGEMFSKICLTWAASELPKKIPGDSEPHRRRGIMLLNIMRANGAVQFDVKRRLSVKPEVMAEVAGDVLYKLVQIEHDGDQMAAKALVDHSGAWNDAMQRSADDQRKLKPRLYREISQTMKNRLLASKIA